MWRRVLWTTGWMIGVVILLGSACPQHRDKGDIEGTVIDGVTQEPLLGVMVSIEPAGSSTQTDAKGMFAFDELSAGFYTVYYSREDYRDAEQEVLVKEDAITQADMAMHPATGRIIGTIIDSITEEELSGVHVWIEGGPSDNSGPGGTYVLEVQEGEHLVHYRKEGYEDGVSDREITVEGGKDTPADYQLRPLKGIIYGRITDVNTGQPIAGASITTTPSTESKTSDSDGNYTIGPINVGSYTVIVTAADYRDASKEVHLEPGDRKPVDFHLVPSPTPKVTITRGPEDGATLSTPEVTFGWEGNTTTYRYRVVNSPYYENFRETKASSVNLEDLDEREKGQEQMPYAFEVVAVGEDERESQPDTRSFWVDCIQGPAVWLRSRRVLIPDPSVSPEFTLEVMAEEVVDLLMAHIVVRFDAERVKIRTVDRGDFLSSASNPDHLLFFSSDILDANSSGELIVDMGVLQSSGSPAASGSGVLAQIRFSVLVGSQEAEVYFAPETKLVDARNEDMALKAKIGARIEIR